ncbi:MAG TPA: glycosyltransferase family A protein [Acidobacteriaceae bacterium]|jgi:glycosyltransferase involved in cell wall biosynthesis|nr:glycosyltransferase family A protein [Acidobacteriaceae bacterium]
MATVDVIIPSYNGAKYLPFALDSVLAQSFDDWRILVVDDGSTDHTPEVIAPYLDRLGAKIRYIKQENQGISAARNTAIKAATAEFLAFLDADDVWLPCRLSDSLELLRRRPEIGLTYGGITLIDAAGQPGQTFTGSKKNMATRIGPQIYCRDIHIPCVTVTVRRQCITEAGAFDESMRVTEDRDLWFRIVQRYDAGFIPKALAYYRVSPDSMTTDPERMLEAQLRFIHRYYGSQGCGLGRRQLALSRAYVECAQTYAKKRRPWKALGNSLKAVALLPFSKENLRAAGSILFRTATRGRR